MSGTRGGEAPPGIVRLAEQLTDAVLTDVPMRAELAGWMHESGRFRTFAEAHRDKIRKKIRTATDRDALLDVRAELRVARLLLDDRRIGLGFEALGSTAGGPDFAVAFREHPAFHLEVTRVRRDPGDIAGAGPMLGKLRQFPAGAANVLLLALGGGRADAFDTAAAVRELRARADARDDAFFARRGLDSARRFYDRFLRLGAVIAWCDDAHAEARTAVWLNRSARLSPASPALRAVERALQHGA
jgi:hypothetical protein